MIEVKVDEKSEEKEEKEEECSSVGWEEE